MKSLSTTLSTIISKLQRDRQEHLDAVAKIDAIFAECGIQPAAPKRKAGRPAKAKAAAKPAASKRRKVRRKFAITGNDSILAFVKKAGAKGVMGAEIAKHWKAEGRGAGVYVAVGKLVKAKKLKREKVKGEKGSRYRAA